MGFSGVSGDEVSVATADERDADSSAATECDPLRSLLALCVLELEELERSEEVARSAGFPVRKVGEEKSNRLKQFIMFIGMVYIYICIYMYIYIYTIYIYTHIYYIYHIIYIVY